MAARESHTEQSTKCIVMVDDPLENVWHISRSGSEHTNMLSISCKLNFCVTNLDRVDQLGVCEKIRI